jgi:hypothetical protein
MRSPPGAEKTDSQIAAAGIPEGSGGRECNEPSTNRQTNNSIS